MWRGVDEHLDRPVTVKVLRAHLSDPELAGRFRREARIAARLQHPGIAVVLGAGAGVLGTARVTAVLRHTPARRQPGTYPDSPALRPRCAVRLHGPVRPHPVDRGRARHIPPRRRAAATDERPRRGARPAGLPPQPSAPAPAHQRVLLPGASAGVLLLTTSIPIAWIVIITLGFGTALGATVSAN